MQHGDFRLSSQFEGKDYQELLGWSLRMPVTLRMAHRLVISLAANPYLGSNLDKTRVFITLKGGL